MSKALALRPARSNRLMTNELRKRERYSLWELYKIYALAANAVLGMVVIGLGIAVLLVFTGTLPVVLGTLIILFGAVVTCWATALSVDATPHSGALTVRQRKWEIYADELRRGRAHRDDELARLPEMYRRYSRWSVQVKRDGTCIKLVALQHKHRGKPYPLIRWESNQTTQLYDVSQGTYGEENPTWVIAEPTVDAVLKKLAEAQLVVEELENKSYAEGLKRYRLDCLALAMQPPPVSTRTQARLVVEEHGEMEDELKRILST